MDGEASKQGDIYSYGILVLEILTAKRPTDEMFRDGFNLHNFVKAALPQTLLQIVDTTLLSIEVAEMSDTHDSTVREAQDQVNNKSENFSQIDANMEKCMISVLNIGLGCSKESPRDRITVRDVSRELHFIRNAFLQNGVNHENGPSKTCAQY